MQGGRGIIISDDEEVTGIISLKVFFNHSTNAPPPALVFLPLLKISLVNPYLKILDLAKRFVADAPIKKTKI